MKTLKLTVGENRIALKAGTTISIERVSPLLNDSPGSFSYPYPVPNKPNEQALGRPGKLQRVGDIETQDFILEDGAFQILRGQVDYDPVTREDIPLIFKSGYSEFRGKMAGRKLSEISFGYEYGLPDTSDQYDVIGKLAAWDDANRSSNEIYAVSPCYVRGEDDTAEPVPVNLVNKTTGMLIFSDSANPRLRMFMLQFYAYFILEKIFESAGYAVVTDELATSEFAGYTIFSKVIRIRKTGAVNYFIEGMKTDENLYYSKLMPDMTALDFVDGVLGHLCLYPDIDERAKTVKILRKDFVLEEENKDKSAIKELTGWEHSEEGHNGGFKLSYGSQDNDLDTESDYEVEDDVDTLPTPDEEGKIVHIPSLNRDYITVLDAEVYSWQQIGRLKSYSEGNASESIEFNMKIPSTKEDPEGLPIPLVILKQNAKTLLFETPPVMIVSIYRGVLDVNTVGIPYLSADAMGEADPACLTPAYLYAQQFAVYLTWKVFNARAFTKYALMTLLQAIELKWYKTYVMNGIEIILDKVNFDLPFPEFGSGVVKIEGWTARVEEA